MQSFFNRIDNVQQDEKKVAGVELERRSSRIELSQKEQEKLLTLLEEATTTITPYEDAI